MREAGEPVWLLLDARGVGGIETHVAALCAGLRRRGADARVVLLSDYGDTPARRLFNARELPVHVLAGGFLALHRALRAQRPSLVHTHGYKAGVLGRIAAALTGTACVSTHHAGERGAFPVNFYQRLDEALSRLSRNVAVSAQIAARVRGAVVIPNFVARPRSVTEGELPRVIAFVGRLSVEKGPDLFCEIARRNAGRAAFRMYGDGPMGPDLRASYGGAVDFRGHAADMGSVWAQIGLLLMPSRAEGLPMACLEAMAHGVPVLGARVGALPDVIEHGRTGWLFDAADPTCVDACLVQWSQLDRAAQLAMREACAMRVADRFGENAALDALARVYSDALGSA